MDPAQLAFDPCQLGVDRSKLVFGMSAVLAFILKATPVLQVVVGGEDVSAAQVVDGWVAVALIGSGYRRCGGGGLAAVGGWRAAGAVGGEL